MVWSRFSRWGLLLSRSGEKRRGRRLVKRPPDASFLTARQLGAFLEGSTREGSAAQADSRHFDRGDGLVAWRQVFPVKGIRDACLCCRVVYCTGTGSTSACEYRRVATQVEILSVP